MSGSDMPGFAYLITKEDEVLASGTVGLADVANSKALTLDTKFRIGSITKQFTAASILQLADEGKLSVNDTLDKYFVGFPEGSRITLSHLMNHTSGIVDVADDEMPFKADEPYPHENHVDFIQQRELGFQPSTQWQYSNSGYFLLGRIIEKVSGQSLSAYMQEHLFTPLDMHDTGLYNNDAAYTQEALGYETHDGKAVRAFDANMANWDSAGGGYSTVHDLHKWNSALHGGQVISASAYQQMIMPAQFPPGYSPFVAYGYGLATEKIAGAGTIGHLGYVYGFHSDLLWLPEEKVTYVLLSNTAKYLLPDKDRSAGTVLGMLL